MASNIPKTNKIQLLQRNDKGVCPESSHRPQNMTNPIMIIIVVIFTATAQQIKFQERDLLAAAKFQTGEAAQKSRNHMMSTVLVSTGHSTAGLVPLTGSRNAPMDEVKRT